MAKNAKFRARNDNFHYIQNYYNENDYKYDLVGENDEENDDENINELKRTLKEHSVKSKNHFDSPKKDMVYNLQNKIDGRHLNEPSIAYQIPVTTQIERVKDLYGLNNEHYAYDLPKQSTFGVNKVLDLEGFLMKIKKTENDNLFEQDPYVTDLVKSTSPSYLMLNFIHNIRQRSLKEDAFTVAQSIEDVLQNNLKKAYKNLKHKYISQATNKNENYTKLTSKISTRRKIKQSKAKQKFKTCKKLNNDRYSSRFSNNKKVDEFSSTQTSTLRDGFSLSSHYEQTQSKSNNDSVYRLATKGIKSERAKNREVRNSIGTDIDSKNVYFFDNDLDYFNIPVSTDGINFDELINKISYNNYVDGFKYYLNFQKEQNHQNFSDFVRYQAHRHHKVDDIGKYILNKIPQLTTKKRRHIFDYDTLEDQDFSTRSEDSWFKKHFFVFLDNNTPKKFYSTELVMIKPSTLKQNKTEGCHDCGRKLHTKYKNPRKLKRNEDQDKNNENIMHKLAPKNTALHWTTPKMLSSERFIRKTILTRKKRYDFNKNDSMNFDQHANKKNSGFVDINLVQSHKITANKATTNKQNYKRKQRYNPFQEIKNFLRYHIKIKNTNSLETVKIVPSTTYFNVQSDYLVTGNPVDEIGQTNELYDFDTSKKDYSSKPLEDITKGTEVYRNNDFEVNNLKHAFIENHGSWQEENDDSSTLSDNWKENDKLNDIQLTEAQDYLNIMYNFNQKNAIDYKSDKPSNLKTESNIHTKNVPHNTDFQNTHQFVLDLNSKNPDTTVAAITPPIVNVYNRIYNPKMVDGGKNLYKMIQNELKSFTEMSSLETITERLKKLNRKDHRKLYSNYSYRSDAKPTHRGTHKARHNRTKTERNTLPNQYFATPVPMNKKEFEKFLKDMSIDVEYVNAPLKNPFSKTNEILVPTVKDIYYKNHSIKIATTNRKDKLLLNVDKEKSTTKYLYQNEMHGRIKTELPRTELHYNVAIYKHTDPPELFSNKQNQLDTLKSQIRMTTPKMIKTINFNECSENTKNKYNKRDVQAQGYFTAKNVDALEILLDVIKPLSTEANIQSNLVTRSIQIHIPLQYNIAKRSLESNNVRKIFLAIMEKPVDLKYQILCYEDVTAVISTSTTTLSPIKTETLSPGFYLFVEKVNATDSAENITLQSIAYKPFTPKLSVREVTKSVEKKVNIKLSNKNAHNIFINKLLNKIRFETKNETNAKSKRNSLKKYFSPGKVCDCKVNQTMCKVCEAGDAVISELIFGFENLEKYMTDNCKEIQTFLWMNPTGARKLKEVIRKVDSILKDYYKAVKCKCKNCIIN